MLQSNPLVTLLLVSYNQEAYIREALDGINRQDYNNIELIISDDCSSDTTWDIINSYFFTKKFKKIKKIRQAKNNGLVSHLNKLRHLISGDLIFFAAGDDISESSRVSDVVNYWRRKGSINCSIFTNATVIDSKGNIVRRFYNFKDVPDIQNLSYFLREKRCWIGGFSHACTRNIFPGGGEIFEKTFQEDGILAFRAVLTSNIIYYDLCTVKYRRHDSNTYNVTNLSGRCRLFKSQFYMNVGRLHDFLKIKQRLKLRNCTSLRILLILFSDALKNYAKFVFCKLCQSVVRY
jgi:glycosyltransferase involved in cell wall biosynthesis